MHCILQCEWPQCKVDGLWPSTFCMKQLLPCLVMEVPYGPLGDAILEMGVDATVADVLPVNFTMVNENVVCKSAIVCMILLDFYAVRPQIFRTQLLPALFLLMRETHVSGGSEGARSDQQRWWWPCSIGALITLLIEQ